ncbi:MAG: RimK family alpha-L-glutamate ligase [bacterium]
MKLWILSHLKGSPGNRAVEEAARARGHGVRLVDPLCASIVLASADGPRLPRGPGWPEEPPDVVFARMGSSAPAEAFHVLEYLELVGVPCVNSSESLRRSRDKTVQALALVRAGLPTPPTALMGQELDLDRVLEAVPGPPWIVKLPVSTQGSGVVLAESRRSLRSVVESLHAVGHRVLVQAFVAEAAGTDVRVLVVGGRARAAMRRRGQADEFRSNLHRGGTAEEMSVTPPLGDVAERAAGALGLQVAGVDLLESRAGPLVIEVNSSPGLAGLSLATGKNQGVVVIELLEGLRT